MKALLIIYNEKSPFNTPKIIQDFFDVVTIEKVKNNAKSEDFKYVGNLISSAYNDILFNTENDYTFFLCSSDINDEVIQKLVDFKPTNKDFDFLLSNKSYKLIKYLSGLIVKRSVLLKIGFFDKHVFNNLYLNFLINYSRFFNSLPSEATSLIKISHTESFEFFYWSVYDEINYLQKHLYKNAYLKTNKLLTENMKLQLSKRLIAFSINLLIKPFLHKIYKRIEKITFVEYW